MQQVGFAMKMFEGCGDEYKRRHDALWPRLKELLKETGIKDYTIFLDERTNNLFATLHIENAALLDELPKQAVMKEWWAYMRDIMETNADNSPVVVPLKPVFYMP